MKRKLFLALMLLAMMPAMVSCGDDDGDVANPQQQDDPYFIEGENQGEKEGHYDMIIDWSPVEFSFYAQNSNGDDILDPESELFAADGLTIEFNGRKAEYSLSPELSKACMVHYYGIKIEKCDCEDAKYYVTFGELDGGDSYDDDFVITWKDGSKDVVHYKREFKGGLDVENTWTYNGEKFNFMITK